MSGPSTARGGAPGRPRGTLGYAICSVGRSGSSWFAAMLASTGALGRPAEAFNTPSQRHLVGPDYPADRHAQVRIVLTDLATPNGVYGLKIFPLHLSRLSRTVAWTRALPNLHFVHWRRRDLLGQALSRHRANQTDQWRSTGRAAGTAAYDGEAILAEIRRAALQDARWEVFFARTGIRPLRLVYEDATADPQRAVDAVAALLGLDERPAVDPARVSLAVQRDATTEAWRARFVAEFGDPDTMDEL